MEAGPISGLRLNLAGQVSGPKRSPHILDGCKLSCLWSVEQFTVHCLDDDYVPMCSYVYVIVLVTVCVYIYIYIHTDTHTHVMTSMCVSVSIFQACVGSCGACDCNGSQ